MAADCVPTIRLESAQRHRMVVSAQGAGICGVITMRRRRSDKGAASAHLLVLVWASLNVLVEIFAGTGRVTACLKQLGMSSSFGTDCVRHKQAMSQIVVADLTTESGIDLLMQWLSNRYSPRFAWGGRPHRMFISVRERGLGGCGI
jgi:hypothetical protein